MASLAGPLVDAALARARDPEGLATSRTDTLAFLTHAERFANAITNTVVVVESLTLDPQRLIYPVTALFPACIRVQSVRDGTVDLDYLAWRQLVQFDRKWTRRVADRPQAWSVIGRDLLVIYPAPSAARTVNVVYTKLTAALTQDASPLDTPDASLPAVIDLVELLLDLKQREFGTFRSTLVRFLQRTRLGRLIQVPPDVPEVGG